VVDTATETGSLTHLAQQQEHAVDHDESANVLWLLEPLVAAAHDEAEDSLSSDEDHESSFGTEPVGCEGAHDGARLAEVSVTFSELEDT